MHSSAILRRTHMGNTMDEMNKVKDNHLNEVSGGKD